MMNDYIKNLQNIEDGLSGNYSTSADLNVETIAEISYPNETIASALYSKGTELNKSTDISVRYMAPKKVTVKKYILKK